MGTKQHAVVRAELVTVLREHGFRVTPSRVALLQRLAAFGTPVSVAKLLTTWNDAPNQATVYRMLSDLSAVGIVKRIGSLSASSYFEYTPHKTHHHHVVCTGCGLVEDVDRCFALPVEKKVAKESTRFASIESHSLEFFGTCRQCASTSH